MFLDPIDGTAEFVKGNLDVVQTLLGISVRGRAVAGVANLPFNDDPPVCGMVGAGVINLQKCAREVRICED